MTPDEWRTGLRNEAASVDDSQWAADTVRYSRRAPALGLLLLIPALCIGITAGATLLSQWPVLMRESAHNGAALPTFLHWSATGNPVPLTITGRGFDPALPTLPLLVALFVLAAVASRWRVPAWVLVVSAVSGVVTMSSLTSLLGSGLHGFPGMPLLAALAVAALGILLGLTWPHRLGTR